MIPVRQSTALELSIGPVLDASGVAVTGCVVGDFKIKKTTGNFAALNASATLTHVSAGTYDLVLTTSDTDTVGLCSIAIDDTVNACAPVYLQVMEEVIYDALYAASANTFTGAAGSTKVSGVVLVDTLTTYTGNTVQTGDSYARIGAAGAGLTALGDTRIANLDTTVSSRLATGSYTAPDNVTIASISSLTSDIDTRTQTIDSTTSTISSNVSVALGRIGAFTGTGINTILGFFQALFKADATAPTNIGGTYDPATDSLEASRNNVGTAGAGLTAADDAVLAAIAALNNLSAAQVNAEVLDVLATDTYAEPGQGAPAATTTLAAKINYLYKLMRNKVTQTSTTQSFYADDASTVDHKATVSDDGSTFTRGEIASGP